MEAFPIWAAVGSIIMLLMTLIGFFAALWMRSVNTHLASIDLKIEKFLSFHGEAKATLDDHERRIGNLEEAA